MIDTTKRISKVTYNGKNVPLVGGAEPVEKLTFAQAYSKYRPSDWMKLPAIEQMEDNTAYFLMEVPSYIDTTYALTNVSGSGTKNGSFIQVGTTDSDGVWTGFGEIFERKESSTSVTFFKVDSSLIPSSAKTGDKAQVVVKCWGTNFNCLNMITTQSGERFPIDFLDLKMKASNNIRFFISSNSSTPFFPTAKFVEIDGYYCMFNNDASSLFYKMSNLIAVRMNVKSIGTSPTRTDSMFYGCSSLKVIEGNLFTEHMGSSTNINGMFYGCSSLVELPKLNFPTAFSDISQLFYGCKTLTSLPFDEITTTGNMLNSFFYGCSNLKDLSGFTIHAGNITQCNYMFSNCTSLIHLPILDFNVRGSVVGMFESCNSLVDPIRIDFGESLCTSINKMFKGCTNVPRIELIGNLSNVSNCEEAFYDCSKAEIDAQLYQIGTGVVCNSGTNFVAGANKYLSDINYDLSNIKAGFCNSIMYEDASKYVLNTGTATSISTTSRVRDLTIKFSSAITSFSPTLGNTLRLRFDFSDVDSSFNCNITIRKGVFSRDDFLAIFNSLPTITTGKKLTFTYTQKAEIITDEDKAIVTNKGWVLSM